MKILIFSREQAEAFPAADTDACISILSPGAKPAQLSSGFCDVLRVYFHDLAGCRRYDGCYPEGAVQIDAAMATAIATFAVRHHDVAQLVVHCEAGICRSVAVGLAIGSRLTRSWPFPRWYSAEDRHRRYVHNREVFEAVQTALDDALAAPNRNENETTPEDCSGVALEGQP